MKRGTTKNLRGGCTLLAIFFLFCACTFLPQPVRAQNTVTVTGLSYPNGVAVTPNGEYAYVTNSNPASVSVISTATNTVTTTVTDLSGPTGVAVAPNGGYAYVTNFGSGSGSVSVISTATNTVTASVTVGSEPDAVAVTPNGAYAYVANEAQRSPSGTVSVISTASNTVTATVTVGSWPDGVAVTPNGEYVYVANSNSNSVSVISTATNTVASTVPVGSGPYGVAVTPNGAYAYVTNSGGTTVSVISTATNTVTSTITVGSGPYGVAVTPNGEYAYVTNGGSGSVSVISTATNTVASTVPVGSGPDAVAVTPNGAYAYVTNNNGTYGGGSVSVISTAVLAVSVSPSSWTMDVGQSETFIATASGGSGSYTSYQWYVGGAPQSGQIASTFSFSPVSAGSYSITATVTDSSGATSAQSTATAVTVSAPVTSTPTSTAIPMSTPTPTPSSTSPATPTPTSSPAPTSTPVAFSTFWSENQLTIISVAVVVVVGAVVPSVYYRRLKASRRNLCNKLVAKGEDLVKKNDLPQAAECFAKASIAGVKTKSSDAAAKALERYNATAKSLIIKSFLGGAKPETYERASKLQSEITKLTSNNNMQTSIVGSNLEDVSYLDLLIAKARENDLDFMVDAALKAPEVEHAFLGSLNGSDEVSIVDLAAKLGYSVEAAFRLLSKCINLKKIEGYITSDSKKYVSKEYVQKQLSTHLK